MKRIISTVIISILSLFSCKPEKPKVADGVEYSILKSVFERYPGRQEVKVQTNKEISSEDIRAISEWVKNTTDSETETFIIFYYLPGKRNAWARVDYPSYQMEILPKLEENN